MKRMAVMGLLCLPAFGAGSIAGLWHFDQGAGQIAVDSSKFGNNGQVGSTALADANDPSWTQGKFGSALQFGASTWVQAPSSASLKITGSITLEAWVKLDSYAVIEPVISKWNDIGVPNRGFALGINNGFVRFDVSHTGLFAGASCSVSNNFAFACTESALVYSREALPLGKWAHIAGTFDSSTKTLRVYIDGTLSNSVAAEKATIFDSNEPVLIGAADFGGGARKFFPGAIDEPRVWNRALSNAEVLSSAQAGLRGLWHFSQNGEDSSGLGNHAAIVGPVFANGKFGDALSFDGVNDYAYAGDNVSLGINGAITVEAWVNMAAFPVGTNTFAPIIAKWNDNAGPFRSYALAITGDGSVRFDVSHTGGFSCAVPNNFGPFTCATNHSALAISQKKVALYNWQHIAGVFDGNKIQVFVNGVPDSSIATQGSTIFRTNYPVAFNFAYEGSIGPQFANGSTDEAKIWARALSAAEIAFEANAPTAAELRLPATIGDGGLQNNGGGNGSGAIFEPVLAAGDLTPVMSLAFVNPDAPGVMITSIAGHASNGNGAGLIGSVTGNNGLDALITAQTVNPQSLHLTINLSDKTKLKTNFDWNP